MTTKQIQQALKKAGFDPGPIDGVRGRKTIRAIKEFQAAKGLTVDGIVGRNTARALMGDAASVPATPTIQNEQLTIPPTMPWFQEAFNLIGTQETPGRGSTEAILGWARALRINYDKDEIPWCGLFVAHCVASQ
ncbi:MAG: peptidoglycan-binding protein, partial [Pseudomonadota bacterium]